MHVEYISCMYRVHPVEEDRTKTSTITNGKLKVKNSKHILIFSWINHHHTLITNVHVIRESVDKTFIKNT